MSYTKDFIANEEKKEAFLAVLQVLLAKDILQHEVGKGIARKIITDKNTEGLSEKQLFVFDKYIEPFINADCKKEDCNQKIDIHHLAEAYEFDELYCVDCSLDKNRLEHNLDKED
jgi:hypothetical protein